MREEPAKEKTLEKEKKQSTATPDYFEITLPKFRFKDTPLTPLWVVLLFVCAFLLGMLTTKVQYLEKQQTIPTTAAAPSAQVQKSITDADIKSWAKDLGLNTQKFNSCYDENKFKDKINKEADEGITAGATATPTFFINGIILIGAQPYSEFKKAIDAELAGTATGDRVNVSTGTLPVLGKTDAPVKIIEFSDFECPFCRRFHQDTFPQLKKDYIDSGKAAFYYRHEPLSIHPLAMPFANASECANDQGKFWNMHEKIFKGQGTI